MLLGIGALAAIAVGARAFRPAHSSVSSSAPVLQLPPPAPQPPAPPGIVLHSSSSPATVHGVPIDAARLDRIHQRDHPDWAITYEGKTYYIGYHYVILPDGTIQKGRPDLCPGAHARKHNDWIGICVIGAFSARNNPHWWPHVPTDAQVRSIVSLCEELMSKYHIPPSQVKRHRDVNGTYCPGGRFPYRDILAELELYAAVHPECQPVNPPAAPAPPSAPPARNPRGCLTSRSVPAPSRA
jgi:hypothetical protein